MDQAADTTGVPCKKACLVNILRTDPKILPMLPDVLPVLVPIQRLPHVEGILAGPFVLGGGAIGIIAVIIDHPPEHRVSHLLVHVDGELVADADVQVDEPGRGLVAAPLQRRGQKLGVPETPVRRRDRQDGDVAVPRQTVMDGYG